MYLEKLEIQGFKSFAHKNVLIFPGKMNAGLSAQAGKTSLTSIVGPNGSGKSNVADAVRWALGEQSMKTLRGKKSEDIIFAGSDKKGKLGMAEVSLFLNNEDKRVDLDYSEIVISRRLYRDGESEYLINGSRVRLLDVQMLLAKANFGQKTYSVIGQGLVENFLNTSLSERKEFFDEATGVKQFQIKREDSLNKLKLSLDNLGQSQLLLAEIEPRLKALTRQVSKLEKREALTEELTSLQKEYYSQVWRELSTHLSEVNGKFLELEKDKQDKDKKISKANSELIALEQEPTASDDFAELQARVNEWQSTKIKLSDGLGKINDWLELKKLDSDNLDLASLEKAKADLSKILAESEEEVHQWKNNFSEQDISRSWQDEIRQLSSERDRLTKEFERLNAWLEMKLEAAGKYDLSFLNNRQSEVNKAKHDLALSQAELEREIAKKNTALEHLKGGLEKINADIKEARVELHQQAEVNQDKVVAEVISHLEKSLGKLAEAESELDVAKIKKLLADIKKDIEKVLSLSTGQEARQIVAKLQDKISSLGEKQEAQLAQISQLNYELLSARKDFQNGQERSQLIELDLADLERKLKQAEDKFDAKEVRTAQAKITKELEPIEKSLTELRAKLGDWQIKQDEVRSGLMISQTKAAELRLELTHLDQKIGQARYGQAKQMARLEAAEEAIKEIVGKTLTLETVKQAEADTKIKIGELEDNISEAQDKLKQFNEKQEVKRQHFLQLQRTLGAWQMEVNNLNNELNDLRVNGARFETRLEDLETEIRADFGDLAIIKQHQGGDNIDRTEAVDRIKNLKHQLEQIGSIDQEAEKEYVETKERYDFLSTQVNDLTATINSLEGVIAELDALVKERFDKEFKIIESKFSEYFKILFNGGTAKIVKVVADDMETEEAKETEPKQSEMIEMSFRDRTMKKLKALSRHDSVGLAGIDIVATPPGKKIQVITMLSGGERALTAIALICAIISANPSPFVILDEVDAALDEANSERLAKILDDLSHKTQFIAITHNRALMRQASVLYGVTMGDDGVSKLLSVKLEDVKAA
jgi:chromosome segregation protein